MNYFAHAYRFLGRPRFVTGTALPDWLSVVNRRLRFRPARLDEMTSRTCAAIAELAAGIRQHIEDDSRFHNFTAFSCCLVAVLKTIRPHLNGSSIPPMFLSHLLMEVLLDAHLIEMAPDDVRCYYANLESVDPLWTEWATGEILGQQVGGLAEFIRLFCREKILLDYSTDANLFRRLNQVMRRLRLPALDDSFMEVLHRCRPVVSAHAQELLRALDGSPAPWQNNGV